MAGPVWVRALAVMLGVMAAAPAWAVPTVRRDQMSRRQTMRPLTLPRNVLRVDVGPPDLTSLDGGLLSGGLTDGGFTYVGAPRGVRIGKFSSRGGDPIVSIGLGAAFGLVRNWEIGGHIFPIYIEPQGEFGDIELYTRYRFVATERFDMGVQLKIDLPIVGPFGISADLPMALRIGDSARLESAIQVELLATSDARNEGRPTLGLHLPVTFTANLTPVVWTGIQTGVYTIPTGPQDRLWARLGAVFGYTFGKFRREPVGDMMVIFRFPQFYDTVGSDIKVDVFDVVLGARFYFRLED